MGAIVFAIAWIPLMLIAPLYAEWKVKKEEDSTSVSAQVESKH